MEQFFNLVEKVLSDAPEFQITLDYNINNKKVEKKSFFKEQIKKYLGLLSEKNEIVNNKEFLGYVTKMTDFDQVLSHILTGTKLRNDKQRTILKNVGEGGSTSLTSSALSDQAKGLNKLKQAMQLIIHAEKDKHKKWNLKLRLEEIYKYQQFSDKMVNNLLRKKKFLAYKRKIRQEILYKNENKDKSLLDKDLDETSPTQKNENKVGEADKENKQAKKKPKKAGKLNLEDDKLLNEYRNELKLQEFVSLVSVRKDNQTKADIRLQERRALKTTL